MARIFDDNITFDALGVGIAQPLTTTTTGDLTTTVAGIALSPLAITAATLDLANTAVELVDEAGAPLVSPIVAGTNFKIKITLNSAPATLIDTNCDYTIKVNDGATDLVNAEVDFTAGVGLTAAMSIAAAGDYTLTASIKDSDNIYNSFGTTIALTVIAAADPDPGKSSVALTDGGDTLLSGYPFDVTITIKDASDNPISGEKPVTIDDQA